MAKIVRDDRARQGATGRPVLAVLIGSLILLAIATVALLAWIGSDAPEGADQAVSTRPGVAADPAVPGNPTDRVPPANPAYPTPTQPR